MLKATSKNSDQVKMLEFENEIQERRQREEDERAEMLRKEQEAADDIERDRRHRGWLQQGQIFFNKMVAKEQQELKAKECRLEKAHYLLQKEILKRVNLVKLKNYRLVI